MKGTSLQDRPRLFQTATVTAGWWRAWLSGIALLFGCYSGEAQWLTQTNVIKPGWTAVYFFVDPSSQSLDSLVGFNPACPIDQIWLWKSLPSSAQYLSTPSSPIIGASQWLAYYLPSSGSISTLSALAPNAACLVHSSATTNFIWKVQGQPVPPTYTWDMTGLNLIGFSTPYANPPNFQSYFLQDPAIYSILQVFQYVGGPFSTFNPGVLFALQSTPVTRGQAFWVSATNVNNTYFGPFNVGLPNPSGLNFGSSVGQFTVHLVNTTSNALTVSVRLMPSETPPIGQTPIIDTPPLLVEGALNTTNLTYACTGLDTTSSATATNSFSWTLAPAGTSGSDVAVVLGVNRFALTSSPGSLYAGILQFTDSLGFSEVNIPVSATAANNAGLWVGSATITQVGSYLKTYATNADGTYQYSITTNFQTTIGPAPALVTSNLFVNTIEATNSSVNYTISNQVTVNIFSNFLTQVSSNVFVLSTNYTVNYTVVTNVIIQTNITGYTFDTNGNFILLTANTTNTVVANSNTGTNQLVISNSIPMVSGNFQLSSAPAANSNVVQVVVADLNGDGRPDFVTANSNSVAAGPAVSVYLNTGAGTFTNSASYTTGNDCDSVAVADMNADGLPDLLVANSADLTISILTNNGSGAFLSYKTIALTNPPAFVAAADVNADGKMDVIVSGGGYITVMTNQVNVYVQSIRFAGSGVVAVADVNGDGRPDLIATGSGANLVVWTNGGNGIFALASSPPVNTPGCVIAVTNVNGGGRVDLICASAGNSVTILTNDDTGGFEPAGTNFAGAAGDVITSVAAADFNHDGQVDFICADKTAGTLVVFTNNGSGTFTLAATVTAAASPLSVAAADVNNDGLVDAISANNLNNNNPTLTVFTNCVNWLVPGLSVPVTNTLVSSYATTSLLTILGIFSDPVTNLVDTDNYSTTNLLTGSSPEQYLAVSSPLATTSYSTTNFSSFTFATNSGSSLSTSASTNFFPMPLALKVFTNLLNGATNWISYNLVTNANVFTSSFTTNYQTNSLVYTSTYIISGGVTNLQASTTNLATQNFNLPVLLTTNYATNFTFLIATNPAYTGTTSFSLITNSSYAVTSLNTNLGAVPNPFPLRLILFNDGTHCSLLQRVYYGLRQDTNTVVATTESVLDVSHLSTARRISSAHMPWTAANNPIAFSGQLALGGTLTTSFTNAYDDQAANPFLHTFHPDHNNLDLTQNPPVELPKGSQSYDITRAITLTVAPNTLDFLSLTKGNSSLAGTYQETMTLTGLSPANPRSFTTAGTFSLTRLSTIATLTTQ